MKITDVEAIVIREPGLDGAIADGSQDDLVFQEYCVSDTAINEHLTHESFPLDADGCVAVPTAPGLGVTLNTEIVERYRVD